MIDIPWVDLNAHLREDITPGYHMALICPTRGGKTTLALEGLAPNFENLLVIDSTADPKPPMLDFGKALTRFGSIEGHRRLTTTDMTNESADKIHKALSRAFKQGDIAIYLDEIRQMADSKFLGLGAVLDHLWLFGGKRNVTVIGATQAPRWVPSSFYDQSRIHFLFRIRDRRAMKRLVEIGGDVDSLEPILPTLEKYEFAYINPDGDLVGTSIFPYKEKKTESGTGGKRKRYTLTDSSKRRIGRLNVETK
jgi:hypothetical protein